MRALQLTFVAALALVACGGRLPLPKPPPPLDAKQLAALIYGDFTTLGDLAQRLRGKCPELTAELRTHMTRMKARHVDVETMLRDAKQTTELKTELETYASRLKGLTEKIGADLATTYLSCCPVRRRDEAAKDEPDAKEAPKPDVSQGCPDRYQLERVIADMPTY